MLDGLQDEAGDHSSHCLSDGLEIWTGTKSFQFVEGAENLYLPFSAGVEIMDGLDDLKGLSQPK